MLKKAENLINQSREIIKYLKKGAREQQLALVVVASFSLAAILGAPDSWLPFLSPFKNLIKGYQQQIIIALVGIGLIAFLRLAWLIYKTVHPTERLPEDLTPSMIKGPLSFGPQDGEFFQNLGRENELRRILGYVKDPLISLVVVLGESGAGKTSLLRSGLDYRCKKQNIPVVYWEAVPNESVKRLIETVNRSWNCRSNEQLIIIETLSDLLDASCKCGAVIILDQFEQLDPDDDNAKPIFELLKNVSLLSPPHNTTWIVAFRRDYDPEWRDFELENPEVKAEVQMLSLKLFTDRQATDVIAAIADVAGFTLDEALLKDLLNSLRGKEGVSPVDVGISMLVLDNLAQSKGEKHLTVDDYNLAGGSGGVLTSYLRNQLDRLTQEERKEILNALLRLADKSKRIPEGKPLSELVKDTKLPQRLLESELDRLSSPQVRLLERITSSGTQKEKVYRLPHERIIGSLRELSGLFLAEVEQAQLTLEASFEIWNSKRGSKFLLNSKDLNKILKYSGQLDWGEREGEKQLFVNESRRKRTKTRLATTAVVMILGVISYFMFHQYGVQQMKRDLRQWGLPNDLYEYQHQLDVLFIQSNQVTHTEWIQAYLKELTLQSEGLKGINPLPVSVTVLDLSGSTQLTNLAGIEKLSKLTKLNLSGSGVKSLAGIENLTNLTELNLSDTGVESLAGIEKLTKLTKLTIGSIGRQSPAGVENLTSLTELYLSVSGVKSLAGVENLTNLTELYLSVIRLESLAGIEKLTKLTKLTVGGIGRQSLAGIENLTSLTELYLTGSGVESFAGIEKLTKLTKLNLSSTRLKSLAGLENLTNLTELDLSGSGVESLAGIEKLSKLTKLNLSGTRVKSLAGIENLTNLTDLDLSDTGVESFAGIEKLTKLTKLTVGGIGRQSPAGIENLTNLTELYLTGSGVKSLAGIENLTNLTELNLSHTDVKSLAGIENLTSLTELYLSGTRLESLAGIEKLSKLTKLNLSSTRLKSLKGLENLTSLTELDLSGASELNSLKGLPKSVKKLTF